MNFVQYIDQQFDLSNSPVKPRPSPPPAAAAPPRLGETLQRLRAERGMTLDDLSRVAGVSKSMLSEIERDRANPTIAVTWRLANGLGLALEQLFAGEPRARPTVQLVGPDATPRLEGEGYRLRVLGPMELAGRFEWYELELAAGGALVSDPHDPGAQEHLTVLAGQIEVASGDHARRLRSGDTARYAADRPHAIRNTGRGEARALLVVVHP